MPVSSGKIELWRRIALLLGIIVGVALYFYVAPAMVSVTAIDWQKEQADELDSGTGFISQEKRRLNKLPLPAYIQEKTGGQVTPVDSDRWLEFFQQVQLASYGNYESSAFGNRVSEEDRDPFWKPSRPVAVFFKPGEIPIAEWGLVAEDGKTAYINTSAGGQSLYLQLSYQDYRTGISISKPYRTAPSWLYHPYRYIGIGLLVCGLLLYLFLPRRQKQPDDITYSTGSMLAGDLVAVILLLPFFGLPFLVNGGTVQALTGMWPFTLIMWGLAFFCIILLYYNAWYASWRLELTPEALHLITFRGVRKCRFDQMAAVDLVMLRNPGWFRKLMLATAFLSMLGGRTSTQPAGSALLVSTAAYGGLEIRESSGSKPLYVWFSNQNGGIIINNFNRVPAAIKAAGVQFNDRPREIEGFTMFM